jgi:hypothetical protein
LAEIEFTIMTAFTSRDQALAVVQASLLKRVGSSPDLVRAILGEDDFIDKHGGPGWGPDGNTGPGETQLLREKTLGGSPTGRYYAIRYDDLKFGEECIEVASEIGKWAPTAGLVAAVLAGGAAAALVAVPATVAVATVKGLVLLGMRLRKRAADLSEDEFRVLAALKHFGPQSVSGLVLILNGTRLSPPYPWSEDKVSEVLTRVGKKRLRDGTTQALAEQSGDGLWGVSGL